MVRNKSKHSRDNLSFQQVSIWGRSSHVLVLPLYYFTLSMIQSLFNLLCDSFHMAFEIMKALFIYGYFKQIQALTKSLETQSSHDLFLNFPLYHYSYFDLDMGFIQLRSIEVSEVKVLLLSWIAHVGFVIYWAYCSYLKITIPKVCFP